LLAERRLLELHNIDFHLWEIRMRFGMKIKRIVPNFSAKDLEAAKRFYCDILGLEIAMYLGWIATFTTDVSEKPQLSIATKADRIPRCRMLALRSMIWTRR
jgi:Na+/H+-translocating membrane pyrophosphatase